MKKFRSLMVVLAVIAGAILITTACKGNCKKDGACCAKEACCKSDCCDSCEGGTCCEGKDCQAHCKEMCGKSKGMADSASCGKHMDGDTACCKSGDKKAEAGTAAYSCPMHPDMTSDKPGTCSKCGMELKPKK